MLCSIALENMTCRILNWEDRILHTSCCTYPFIMLKYYDHGLGIALSRMTFQPRIFRNHPLRRAVLAFVSKSLGLTFRGFNDKAARKEGVVMQWMS